MKAAGMHVMSFAPDCGRVMKIVNFDDNDMPDCCHCLDQTSGGGGVEFRGGLTTTLKTAQTKI